MNKQFLARKLHKWFGLVIGLQLLIWLSSGLYMVIVELDFIHGDPLVTNMRQTITIPTASASSLVTLRAQYPVATHIGLRAVMAKTFFSVTTADQRYLIDPVSLNVLSPLDEKAVRSIAAFHFNGDAPIRSATLITHRPPMEIGTRRLPLWRLDFDDRFATSFYIDPYNGSLVTRRHQYWRIFDFLWMLHIMDYDQRADVHNLLLKSAQITGLTFVLSGFWLLYFRLRRRKNQPVSR